MKPIIKRSLDCSDEARSEAFEKESRHGGRWRFLCERYLPVKFDDSVWRYSRNSQPQEPSQGWKLHISATVLEACDLFERVAPFLHSQGVQFKAPNSLDELSKINCGLQYGYRQVGKFMTVYPATERQAVKLARKLDDLTREFVPVNVPFDEQYSAESSVFYRYGGFAQIEIADENGGKFLAIENPAGEFVPDNRLRAIPDWLENPFPNNGKTNGKSFAGTPLGTTYRIFQAITQRGKGGTYLAVDVGQTAPRLCIVKEGRRNGELSWNGQDGYFLVENEFQVLSILKKKYDKVPEVFASFELHGSFYFVMENVGGKSLHELIRLRRRRLSVRQTLQFAVQIARIIKDIHRANWVWNDCKPANLILTKEKTLRPIDFEGAYQIGKSEPFDWKTKGFSNFSEAGGVSADIYALGAVAYFLLTGRLYDSENPQKIAKLRRNIPPRLTQIIEKLLADEVADIAEAETEFEEVLKQIER